jgi:hypothetical protein
MRRMRAPSGSICSHVCMCVCVRLAVQACATGVNSMATLQLVLLLSECLVFWCVCRLAVQALCNELASEHGNSASTMVFAVNLLWCCACACATCGSGDAAGGSRLLCGLRMVLYQLCQLLVLCMCACATCGSGERQLLWSTELSAAPETVSSIVSVVGALRLCVRVRLAVQAMQPVGQLSTVGLPVVFPLRSVPLSIFNDRSLRSHLP